MYVLKVNSNSRAFVGESSSYSYEESEFYVLGDDVAQTIRERFFIDRSKRKDISTRAEKNDERRKLFVREREREDLARTTALKNFFAAIDFWWFKQNFLFRFPFFPLLLLFQQAVFTGKKNEKFGLNSASKRPH